MRTGRLSMTRDCLRLASVMWLVMGFFPLGSHSMLIFVLKVVSYANYNCEHLCIIFCISRVFPKPKDYLVEDRVLSKIINLFYKFQKLCMNILEVYLLNTKKLLIVPVLLWCPPRTSCGHHRMGRSGPRDGPDPCVTGSRSWHCSDRHGFLASVFSFPACCSRVGCWLLSGFRGGRFRPEIYW